MSLAEWPGRVLVAMSGGVDSSVAAALLVEQGYDVTGVTLKLWGGDSDSGCCSVSDVEDARRVAAQLDIPHYVFNFSDDFGREVVDPYVAAYANARTPNPCIECNRTMKWGRLLDRADALGFETIATGHHARVARDGSQCYRLLRGADAAKDQSYVLYMLTQRELERTRLPVGHMTKSEVRVHAQRLGLRTADKSESMDVCFITKGGREQFLQSRTPTRPGLILDTGGSTVGTHRGVHAFTVGQRRGLDVAATERRFVVDLDATSATVTLGSRSDLLREWVDLDALSFVGDPPERGQVVSVQVRAHGLPFEGCLEGDRVRFATRQQRVAPGQIVVLYDDDRVIGGGIAN